MESNLKTAKRDYLEALALGREAETRWMDLVAWGG